jgi:hypothetical protein
MTVGYVSCTSTSVASGAYFTIQPTGTVEVVVHNIYCGASAMVYYGSGTATCVPIYSLASSGWVTGIFSHVTNAQFIMVKNNGTGNAYFAYDGIVSRD